MNIDLWLSRFKKYWTEHNVPEVLKLFHDEVVYFETPFQRLESKAEIQKAWEGIKSQNDIKIDCTVYSKDENKFSVIWALSYIKEEKVHNVAGTYLITLDEKNLCTYFFHCCESKS